MIKKLSAMTALSLCALFWAQGVRAEQTGCLEQIKTAAQAENAEDFLIGQALGRAFDGRQMTYELDSVGYDRATGARVFSGLISIVNNGAAVSGIFSGAIDESSGRQTVKFDFDSGLGVPPLAFTLVPAQALAQPDLDRLPFPHQAFEGEVETPAKQNVCECSINANGGGCTVKKCDNNDNCHQTGPGICRWVTQWRTAVE